MHIKKSITAIAVMFLSVMLFAFVTGCGTGSDKTTTSDSTIVSAPDTSGMSTDTTKTDTTKLDTASTRPVKGPD